MKDSHKLTACIVDDEAFARDMLKQMITKYTPEIELIGEAEDVDSAIKIVKAQKPDILFLDIEMPDGNGFDVLQSIGQIHLHIVFVTAYNDYALRAIKFHAFDYLLKPLSRQDLIQTIKDLSQYIDRLSSHKLIENLRNNLNENDVNKHSIAITNNSETLFIPIDTIIRCKADRSYTRLYLKNGKELFTSKNLGEFEKILPSPESSESVFFFRVHHSELINVKFIKSFNRKSSTLLLKNDEELIVAQRRKASFVKILADFHLMF